MLMPGMYETLGPGNWALSVSSKVTWLPLRNCIVNCVTAAATSAELGDDMRNCALNIFATEPAGAEVVQALSQHSSATVSSSIPPGGNTRGGALATVISCPGSCPGATGEKPPTVIAKNPWYPL